MVSVPADSEKRRAIKRKEGESLDTPYAIEMLHITKRFPGIIANDDITLQVKKGEIHALLGENGAGKSTLMSVLFGLYQAEEGTIRKDGVEVSIKDPNDANALGIGMVHQHFKLVECFSVLDNIIMGVEPTKHGFFQKKEARERVLALSEKYGLKVDPDALIEDITVGMQQRTEILKMLYRENEILIFDEPTAVLTPQEIDELMEIHSVHLPQAQRDHGRGGPLHRAPQGQVRGHRRDEGHHHGAAFRHDGGPERQLPRGEEALHPRRRGAGRGAHDRGQQDT